MSFIEYGRNRIQNIELYYNRPEIILFDILNFLGHKEQVIKCLIGNPKSEYTSLSILYSFLISTFLIWSPRQHFVSFNILLIFDYACKTIMDVQSSHISHIIFKKCMVYNAWFGLTTTAEVEKFGWEYYCVQLSMLIYRKRASTVRNADDFSFSM